MRSLKVWILVILAVSLVFDGMGAAGGKRSPEGYYREGEVLVRYRPHAGSRQRGRVRSLVRARSRRSYRHIPLERLSVGEGLSAVEALEILKADPDVEYAELNMRVDLLAAPRLEPDDPGYISGNQWYLDAPLLAGSHVGTEGTVYIDIDIDAPEAWAVMARAFGATTAAGVGVIDSGCGEMGTFSFPTGYLPGHEDLPNSVLWRNPVEAAGTFNLDDDGNSYRDDINGWDFAGNDNTMADAYDSTAPYHGTHISGIVAGAWANSIGVAGMGMDHLKVLPLRASFTDEIVGAIDYAIDTGGAPPVMVLNASWKFPFPVQSLQDAIEAARAAGIAFVAAAGNEGNNNDIVTGVDRVYPAQYTGLLDNVLAVGATGPDGRLASFSNYGPQSVQIAAPGVNIYSPHQGASGYSNVSGTSFSAPVAASALALVMAANPDLTPAQAIDRLVDGGDFDARLAGLVQSGKRVNLAGALAPFAPYSGYAPVDTLVPVSLYADTVSLLYGSLVNAISASPSIAVMVTTSGGAWAVSPVSPGLTTFELNFDGAAAPAGTYETGLWRVTGISPFSAQVEAGQSIPFTSLLPGATIDWKVNNSLVGTIDSGGLFTALSHGTTQVVLTVDGRDVDNTGIILVIGLDEDLDGYRAGLDCDDSDPSINPGAGEVCTDGIDNDCDGLTDREDSECQGGGGGGGGGCGTTSLPPEGGEPMWPVILVLAGMALILVRRNTLASTSDPRSRIQDPDRE